MILSLALIVAVVFYHVNPLVLFFLFLTWIPDVILIGVLGGK